MSIFLPKAQGLMLLVESRLVTLLKSVEISSRLPYLSNDVVTQFLIFFKSNLILL